MKAILLLAASLAAGGPAAAAAPRWTVLADCAAAYRANARLADPDRPAAMTAQISDVAEDYAAAARKAHAGKDAKRDVAARIEAQAHRDAALPREAVERIIDACPQVEG